MRSMDFRKLDTESEKEFRKWARHHYTNFDPIDGLWHPVIQDECVRMNFEASIFTDDGYTGD